MSIGAIKFTGRSRTHQSFAKDADINNIMQKYKKTGVLVDPSLLSSARAPRWGDFSDICDFTTQMNRLSQAKSDFLTLPADLRARFSNDVSVCLDFIADPANVREAVELGLLPKSAIVTTDAVVGAPAKPEPTPPKVGS